jgi:2-desacetyl-2-hydroxyethyl bacteriochlorophyllide A dehydrogenase
MRTIYVEKAIPRIVAMKLLSGVWPGVVWSRISAARVDDVPPPKLPGPRWLRVRNRVSGICGSDLSLLFAKADPSIAPAALPGIQRIYLGHEVVGEVDEVGPGVTRFKVGDRVIMQSRHAGPSCFSQEIEPPCGPCARGQTRHCENASLGKGPQGVGGGWSDGYTAHESEVYPVPQGLTDEQAVLVEPAAVALHAVLRRAVPDGGQALVVGAGTIGLLVLQCAKVVAPSARVTVIARYPQQAEAARRLGADHVVTGGDLFAEMARLTAARHYAAPLNRGTLLGGFDAVYDCVGARTTLQDALRWARAGGAVVMVGITLRPMKVDLNPVWHQEVDLIGAGFFGTEEWRGRRAHTYTWVVEWLQAGQLRVEGLITHRFPLGDYRRAIGAAIDKTKGTIKAVFDVAA